MEYNYYFDVNDNLKKLIVKCIDELRALDVPISTSVYFRELIGGTYSNCQLIEPKRGRHRNYDFVVSINKYILKETDYEDAIINVLLWTVTTDGFYVKQWKYWANYVNNHTNHHITRTEKYELDESDGTIVRIVCPICNAWYQVRKFEVHENGVSKYRCTKCKMPFYTFHPQSPVQDMDDEQKRAYVYGLINDNALNEMEILNALPYINQNLHNEILLLLLKKKPKIFLDNALQKKFIYPIFATSDKKAQDELANLYMSGKIEELNSLTHEFVTFAHLFCGTENSERVWNYFLEMKYNSED